MRRIHMMLALAVCTFWPVARAEATFHLWNFQEVFSNTDGTIQFIELFTAVDGQEFALGEQFRSSQGANVQTYTFPTNTPFPTAGHHLLIATSGFASLPGAPTPDFVMPDGFLFSPDGVLENLSLFGPTFSYANLPTDGLMSLAGDGVTTALNSPTNYAGATGSIDATGQVPTVSAWGILVMVGLLLSAGTLLLKRQGALVPG